MLVLSKQTKPADEAVAVPRKGYGYFLSIISSLLSYPSARVPRLRGRSAVMR